MQAAAPTAWHPGPRLSGADFVPQVSARHPRTLQSIPVIEQRVVFARRQGDAERVSATAVGEAPFRDQAQRHREASLPPWRDLRRSTPAHCLADSVRRGQNSGRGDERRTQVAGGTGCRARHRLTARAVRSSSKVASRIGNGQPEPTAMRFRPPSSSVAFAALLADRRNPACTGLALPPTEDGSSLRPPVQSAAIAYLVHRCTSASAYAALLPVLAGIRSSSRDTGRRCESEPLNFALSAAIVASGNRPAMLGFQRRDEP